MNRHSLTVSILLAAAGLSSCGSENGEVAPRAVEPQSTHMMRVAVIAVTESLRQRLPAGTFKLDATARNTEPRLLAEGVQAWEGTMQLGREIGLPVTTLAETRVCEPRRPSSCRLEDAVALIRVSEPKVYGNTAKIEIMVWLWTSSPRRPVAAELLQANLERKADEWEVVNFEVLGMS